MDRLADRFIRLLVTLAVAGGVAVFVVQIANAVRMIAS